MEHWQGLYKKVQTTLNNLQEQERVIVRTMQHWYFSYMYLELLAVIIILITVIMLITKYSCNEHVQ